MPYVTINEETEGKWWVLSLLELSQQLIDLGSIFAFAEGAASEDKLDLIFFRGVGILDIFLGFSKGICYLICEFYQIQILYIAFT